jgi:DNA-binding beta-propeller fold protein YncE
MKREPALFPLIRRLLVSCPLSVPALLVPALLVPALLVPALLAQQPPQATELPGSPFFIKNTWIIGGTGNWDYLTMDPVARRLYIAHGPVVQVVDVETGALAGQITGLRDAHAIALDAGGEFGYISDGQANEVKVFDRQSFQVVAAIATGPTPRALVLDAQTGLLFAICTSPLTGAAPPSPPTQAGAQPPIPGANPRPAARNPIAPPQPSGEIKTSVTVIDVLTRKRLGQILMPGKLGFAASDGNGQVFVLVVDRNQVARLDAPAIAALLRQPSEAGPATASPTADAGTSQSNQAQSSQTQSGPAQSGPAAGDPAPTVLDWSRESRPSDSAQNSMRLFRLGSDCSESRSLAVDGAHQRVFAACNNMKLTVLNAGTGELVTTLPIGPGADAVGYDPGRGLIYIANGDAQGTLTIIQQDVTDTYAEIQNLATRQRARTLAVNSDTGQVYLVTDYMGVNLNQPGGIGSLKNHPVSGSFQVLVVGH